MVENWLSSGVATADAMVSGSAPGSEAETTMVGKSTFGKFADRQRWNSRTCPKITSAAISSVVMTGRRMKGSEMFIGGRRRAARHACLDCDGLARHDAKLAFGDDLVAGLYAPCTALVLPSSYSTVTGIALCVVVSTT